MKQVRARYVIGLKATTIRKDGYQPIIFMQCGPIRYSDSRKPVGRQSTECKNGDRAAGARLLHLSNARGDCSAPGGDRLPLIHDRA